MKESTTFHQLSDNKERYYTMFQIVSTSTGECFLICQELTWENKSALYIAIMYKDHDTTS